MADRGTHRGIYTALVDDPDFQRLSPQARLTLLVTRLCRQAGPAVIFRYYPALLALQTGLSPKGLEAALGELEAAGWIAREGVVLWVRNGLRFDPSMRLSNEKHRKAVEKAVMELPKLQIVLTFCEYYQITKPFDSPAIANPGLVSPNTEYRDTTRGTTRRRPSEAGPAGMAIRPGGAAAPTSSPIWQVTPDVLDALKANPAYAGIDVDRVAGKLRAWLLTPRGRGKRYSLARLVAWLNREEPSAAPPLPYPGLINLGR